AIGRPHAAVHGRAWATWPRIAVRLISHELFAPREESGARGWRQWGGTRKRWFSEGWLERPARRCRDSPITSRGWQCWVGETFAIGQAVPKLNTITACTLRLVGGWNNVSGPEISYRTAKIIGRALIANHDIRQPSFFIHGPLGGLPLVKFCFRPATTSRS